MRTTSVCCTTVVVLLYFDLFSHTTPGATFIGSLSKLQVVAAMVCVLVVALGLLAIPTVVWLLSYFGEQSKTRTVLFVQFVHAVTLRALVWALVHASCLVGQASEYLSQRSVHRVAACCSERRSRHLLMGVTS